MAELGSRAEPARPVLQHPAGDVDVDLRRGHPVRRNRNLVAEVVRVNRAGEIRRRAVAGEAIGFDGRQGGAVLVAAVERAHTGAQLVRDLSGHVVVGHVLLVRGFEGAGRAVLREPDGALAGHHLGDAAGVEPDAVAYHRAAEFEDRLPIGVVGRLGLHVLRDRLIGRIQPQRLSQRTAQAECVEVGPGAAVPVVAPGLCQHAHDAARRRAVFGVVAAGFHLHLGDEVGADRIGRRVVGGVVPEVVLGPRSQRRHVQTVDQEVVFRAARSIQLVAAGLRLVAGAWRLHEHARKIASFWNAVDHLRRDHRAGGILPDVDDGRRRHHLNAFRDASDGERDVNLQDLAQQQLNAGDFPGTEAGERGRNVIDTGRQRREAIDALCVTDGGAGPDERRAPRFDGHAGQDGAGGVPDDPFDGAARLLRPEDIRQRRERQRTHHHPNDVSHSSLLQSPRSNRSCKISSLAAGGSLRQRCIIWIAKCRYS